MAATKHVLIATTSTEWGYQRETMLGIREYAEGKRWTLSVQLIHLLARTQTSRDVDGSILDLPESGTCQRDIDGIILDQTEGALYRPFADLPMPKVSYCDSAERSPLPRVRLDNAQAGALAAQHFLERNIRKVAFFGVDRAEDYAIQRQAGFARALEGKRAEFESVPQRIVLEDRGRAFHEWLDRTRKPVGLLAADDYLARRIAQRCMDWAVSVPRDVLILGINNDVFHCEFCQPSLSSVILPSRAIGYKAAEILDTLMQGRRLAHHEILIPSPGVVERVSTKTTAFDCPELDRALRFIRQYAAQSIAVKQVVEYAAVSKRSLEIAFEKHLGHGPSEELRRARLALAKYYLTTTNRPISEVASLSGFSNATHLGRVLQRFDEQTPLEYRRRHASVGE